VGGGKGFDCIYIDPPYNPPSNSNTFLYNNKFNHSTWLTFIKNRLEIAKQLLKRDGSIIVAIDENELFYLGVLLNEVFPDHEVHCITIVHNPRGVQGKNFSYINEFALFVIPNGKKIIGNRNISDNEIKWSNFRNWGTESNRTDAKNCFYSIKVKDNNILGFGEVLPEHSHPNQTELLNDVYEIYPIDRRGVERKWRFARQSVENIKHLLRAVWREDRYEIELGKDYEVIRTVWQDSRYDANVYGTQLLKELIPECDFSFPKSLWTVHDCIQAVVGDKKDAKILDFFAGSGTTGHAVLEMNKKDGGSRNFVMIEQLDYVQAYTKERIIKVIERDRLNTRFIYAELADFNSIYIKRIGEASDIKTLLNIYNDMISTGFLRYKFNPDGFNPDEFKKLEVGEAKDVLLECLDVNHFNINLASLGDEEYEVSDEDAATTRRFYGLEE